MQTVIIIVVVLVVLYLLFKLFKTVLKWLLLALVVVLAIAFFSNPKEDDHLAKLKALKKEVRHKIKHRNVKVDDYKIFSLTRAKVKGEDKIVGIGAFGKVWYFDDLKDEL